MAVQPQLDVAGGSRKGCVIRFFLPLLASFLLSFPGFGQDQNPEQARLAAARSALDSGNWDEAARLTQGPADQSSELDFLRGLALSRLERWDEAKLAFEAGARKSPHDSRFPVELAGIAYKQKDLQIAKKNLQKALRLNPADAYTHEFLATVYFLEGNLEAALKYWNPEDKPRLRSVSFAPSLQLNETLRNRALAFNAPQVLNRDALLTTESRLDNLGIFSRRRTELTPFESGNYDLALHLGERNLWGDSKVEGIVSFLSGLPYATVYPELYNLRHEAINVTSLVRWDAQKRRAFVATSLPLYGDPSLRLRFFVDARNENWNLSQTFTGAVTPLTDVNLRRIAVGAQFHAVVTGRWSWSAGAEAANRTFRNISGATFSAQRPFFNGGNSLAGWMGAERTFVRIPERRFTLDSSAEARAGREFATGLGPFATTRGTLMAHWFPRAKGDDYEMRAQVRAGATAGKVSLDELFQLGVERDNDLWLRGHAGTTDGRKGAAPLGRRYFLANWEMDKNVYANGFFTLKIGPFLDNGAIADSSGLFGSRAWQWDSGLQCKVRILGGVTAVFSYGRNLRGGKGVFYGTVLR
jgi:tetratricopeptide (TPR) repeat protein